MTFPTDNEAWLIETGGLVIEKMSTGGVAALSAWEKLLYCLWVTDYGMRNAGDLGAAADVYADYKSEALRQACTLGLEATRGAFAMSDRQLAQVYFEMFEAICDEVRQAQGNTNLGGG